MEELPPLVPDLTAWFEALLARVSALEARSEQGGAAATEKAAAQEQALQDLQKQKEADAVAMTSMREALAERESELASMRMEMDAIRADLAARGAVFGGFQADVKDVRGMLVAARLLKTARDGKAASLSGEGLENERAANEARYASREDVRILSETVRELEAMITGVERLSGEAQAQLESMRDEIAEQLRAEAEADRERVERERAEREAEAARLEAEIRAEREAREAADRERAEQEAAARDAAEHERVEKETADQEAAEQERADKEAADQETADRERADKEAADQADRERAEQEAADEDAAQADRERAEQEAADQAARERAEQEQAEAAARERADREAAEAQEAAKRAAKRRWRAALKFARTQAKMVCTIRAMKPPDRPTPLHDNAVYHRLRDGVIEQDALAKRLAALEDAVKDDAKLSADILRKGVVGLGGTAENDDDALVERRAAQSALMAALVDGRPTTTKTVEVADTQAMAYGNGRGALAEFDKDIDRRFAEFACRQQKLLDDFHVEVEVFTRAQEKLESGLVKVNEDLNRMTSINDKRYAQRSAADQERDSKLEAAAASARRAAEAVARLANVPPTSDTTLKFAEAPAAAPTDLGDVWDRIHTKADGTAVLKLREELREIAAALAGDPALTRRRKAICSGALGVRKSAYVLKDGVEVCISCQRPGSPSKRETVQFEERPKTYKSRPPMGARAKPSIGRVRPASAGPLRNSKRRGEGAFSGRMTGRPASATARLLAEGDATAEVIDLRYPVRRRDERSEADRRKAGFPSY